jgi:aminoglycoside phosphotransferase (APT) family kinase protein
MPVWDAEIPVDAALARRLIAEQFPLLAEQPVSFLATGWDNAVFLVDGVLAFRFPQRAIAIPGIQREIAVLPALGPMLPAPLPVPSHVGRPSASYPWPFLGAPFIDGSELAASGTDTEGRRRLAGELGEFLAALHRPELAERFKSDLPVDPLGRADMSARVAVTRKWLGEAAELGIWDSALDAAADVLMLRALAAPESGSLSVAHGDLHVRHVMLDARGGLAGVIDWGDMCLADPAIDLSLAWSAFDGPARGALLDAYGPIDDAAELRGRVLGLMLSAALAVYGRTEGLPWLEAEAAEGLRRVLQDGQ